MGFDLLIELSFSICHETGKPFYYIENSNGNLKKEYNLSNIEVPEKYRKYLKLRGKIFHAYTEHFNLQEIFETDVSIFLDDFPDWKTVCEYKEKFEYSDDEWTEAEHQEFYFALVWCVGQPQRYMVTWSY